MEQAIFLTEKQMDKQMNSLTMTAREIFDVTGYKQPARQKRVFETLGVPVHIRPDGTVSVCRQHYLESHTHTQVQKRGLPQLRIGKRNGLNVHGKMGRIYQGEWTKVKARNFCSSQLDSG